MANADFTHKIKDFAGRNVIVIEDLNLGGMSVTNNIETVVGDIAIMERIDPQSHMIVYKDSEGVWDGWDPKEKVFVHLNEESWRDAVEKYISRQLFAVA